MKQFIVRILIIALVFSGLTIAVFHDEAHLHHIEAINPGDDIGQCDEIYDGDRCSGRMMVVEVFQATCTESGTYMAQCTVCGTTKEGTIAALGHDFSVLISSEEPTCTTDGRYVYECSRCSQRSTSYPAALGHNYKKKITKEATCEEDGITTYTCSRCGDSYTKKIEKLGHDVDYEEKEPTCTEPGYKKGICRRCGKEDIEEYKALGHDLEPYTIIKQPTCEEDGIRTTSCRRCGEEFTETILHPGHKYPKEWTLEKEASYFEEGLESRVCFYCEHKETRIIPKKSALPIYTGVGVALAAVLGGLLFYFRKFRKVADKALKEKFKPSFEDKTILCSSKDEHLVEVLKSKSFLEVSTCDNGELEEQAEEAGPDLIITDVLSEERLEELLKRKEEGLSDYAIGVMTIDEFLEDHREKLDQLVEDKTIVSYLAYEAKESEILTKMILPIMKPDLKSDESLENIGSIADLLGIPGVSSVINAYVSGRDIKATLEEGELGVSETATIIGDIASILGLDTVASVAGLVDDVNSIKAAVDREAGAYEHKSGVNAAKDVVEVVSDIINKD